MAGTNNLNATQEFEMDGVRAPEIQCRCCCCWNFQLEDLVHCSNGHPFCFKCLNRSVEEIIYGGCKAHTSLSCMAIGDGCRESIPLSEIRRALPNDMIERYEYRMAQEAVAEASIEGLVYCPFCSVPYEVDNCLQVLDCPNPKCLKASCIQCKKMSHLPLRCEEFEITSNTSVRTAVEERMAKAVIRECNICRVGLVKTNGCNKLRCRCGNTMCYVCRQTISLSSYAHFCNCRGASTELGKRCQKCKKCSLAGNDVEDNEALAAKAEAVREMVGKEPKFLDVDIGPPLEKLRQQPPIRGHRPSKYRRSEGSGGARLSGQRANMAEYVPSSPAIRHGDMAEYSPLSSPTRFLREGVQHVNMVQYPPRFFENDDQPTNMVEPPPRLSRD